MANSWKKISLKALGESMVKMWKRFPLASLFIVAFTCWLLFLEWENFKPEILTRYRWNIVTYYLGVGVLLSVVLQLWCEEIQQQKTARLLTWGTHLLWLLNALILAFYFEGINSSISAGMAVMIGGLLVCMIVLPFHREKDDMASWNFGLRLIGGACVSICICLLMYGGVALLVLSLNKLFDIKIPTEINMTVTILCLVTLPSCIWISKIPEGEEKFSRESFSSSFAIKCIRYLLIPLLICYIVILYIYEFKSLVTWTLPDGWVSTLVSALMAGYLLLTLLFYAAKKENLSQFDRWLNRIFPLLILSLVAMMTVGLVRRFSDYGVTANRLYMTLLNLWFYYVLIRLYFFPSKRISWVAVSLAGTLALISLFPVNFHSIPRHIMLGKVRTVLTEQLGKVLPLTDEEYSKAIQDLPSSEASELNSLCAYLASDSEKSLKQIISFDSRNTFYNIDFAKDVYNWERDGGHKDLTVPEGMTHFFSCYNVWEINDSTLTVKTQTERTFEIERTQFDDLIKKIGKQEEGTQQLKDVRLQCTDGSILVCTEIHYNPANTYASLFGYMFYQ